MKKFTKLFLSCAAMAAVTAAVATSAMAADPTVSVTYEQANQNGELTLTVNGVTGEATLLVTKKDIEKDTIADADILYIDQETDGAFTTAENPKVVLRKTGTEATQYLPDGTYNVYVGYTDGEFKIAKKTFTVGNAGTEVLLGDADQDTYVDGSDAVEILKSVAGTVKLEDDALLAADADQDTYVDGSDAVEILKYVAGTLPKDSPVGTKVTVAN